MRSVLRWSGPRVAFLSFERLLEQRLRLGGPVGGQVGHREVVHTCERFRVIGTQRGYPPPQRFLE